MFTDCLRLPTLIHNAFNACTPPASQLKQLSQNNCATMWSVLNTFHINSHIQRKYSNFIMMCVEEIIYYIKNHTFKNQCLKYKKYLAVITHGLELLSTCMTLSKVTTPIVEYYCLCEKDKDLCGS